MGRPKEISLLERADLVNQGFRPVELWVPDAQDPLYRAEADRQARQAAEADRQDDAMDWLEAVAGDDWERL